jgi:adenine-specific DNA methylase
MTIDGEYDAIIADPPYYDAIPYSDLMDSFTYGFAVRSSVPSHRAVVRRDR